MSNKVKTGLSFGISMAVFYIAYNLIFEPTTKSNQQVLKVVVSGVIGGGIAGLLFGWITGKFIGSRFVDKTTQIDTFQDEKILFQSPANHFKDIEGVGGKLYLTNQRLVFKSHKHNIQNLYLSLNLPDIEEANQYNILGLIKTGLSIKTNQQKTQKFVVEKPNAWINQINKAKTELLLASR